MTNYLLSIDPSIKNTGFTLWEKTKRISECEVNYNEIEYIYKWKPILVTSYSFKKDNYEGFFKYIIDDIQCQTNNHLIPIITSNNIWNEFNLIIERGTFHSKNGIGYETQEHLRGFIAGQFNKLITKDMLINPKEWHMFYLNQEDIIDTLIYNENENIGIANHPNNKWNKDLSIKIVNYLSIINNWNIKVNNHDEADSLLIGWYYLNKENK